MDKIPVGSNDALFTDTYLFTCLMCCCAVLCACEGFRRERWGVRGSEREGSYLMWCVAEGIYHHTYKANINIYLMNTCEPFTYKRHFISVIQILDWTALHKYCPQGSTYKYNIQCKTTLPLPSFQDYCKQNDLQEFSLKCMKKK